MVITPQASYLSRVEEFISRMDAGGEGSRLYVYEVKYVKATDLAEQLGKVYGNVSQTSTSGPSLMPGLDPVEVRTTDMPPARAPLPANARRRPAAPTRPDDRRRRSRHQRGGGEQLAAGARQPGAVGIDPPRDRAPRHHAAAGAHRGAGGRGQADRRPAATA
jgi:general secretion pathway protein D